MSKINDSLIVAGHLSAGSMTIPSGTLTDDGVAADAAIDYAKIKQRVLAITNIPMTDCRVFDALATVLPGTAASDDLALVGGTHGSAWPTIRTSDAKATTVTQRLRVMVPLPDNYDDGETITLRLNAGMITTVSDGTATVDVEAYTHSSGATAGSDICATAAASINSLTFANKDFTITPTSMVAGDMLDVRITIAITDTATATAVIGAIARMQLLCDTRG